MKNQKPFKQLSISMLKFGTSSLLGTGMDFLSFTFIFRFFMPIFWAELCSAFIGMVVNFFMQKRFVFDLNRRVSTAFLLSISFSFVFMFAGAFAMESLAKTDMFGEFLIGAKLLVMGAKFLLNYFSKRWVFEKR
ncbi:MAG: hypothetical protein Salg2KO_16510 [Salibacteraceae bacterium]